MRHTRHKTDLAGALILVLLAAVSAFAAPSDPVSISLAGAMLLAGR